MKVIVHLFCVASLLVFSFHRAPAAPAATNQPVGFRLIVELQDGSKIIGKSGDDNFQFHSDVLGEMKLPLERIRSIECRPKTNAVQLVTTNSDTLTAQFVTKVIRVETGFGNFKLPVDLIQRLTVSSMGKLGQMREGLVALWSGEGDGNDLAGGNNATLTDISFADGKAGRAFVFNGSNAKIRVPASPSLNVGLGDGLTIEVWINPANLNLQEICEWNRNDGVPYGAAQIGTHMEINESPGDGSLWGNLVDTSGVSHNFHSKTGIIIPNSFQHIAMTYDKTSGVAMLYRNGVAVAKANLSVFTPQTSFDFFIGTRPSGFFTGIYFQGKMDEMGIYKRALSASEIQTICKEDNSGEPLPPPAGTP
jgi:hypothetical protein